MENTGATENLAVNYTYAGFWPRLGALLLDVCVLLPIMFPLMYFNVTDWKSPLLMALLSLLSLAYKPFFEFRYGATPGKMALNLRVVNLDHQKANLNEILLRNIFQILGGILSFLASWATFNSPEFEEVTGFMEYSRLSGLSIWSTTQQYFSLILLLVDVGFLASDDKCRTLHDRIGKTYVIKTS